MELLHIVRKTNMSYPLIRIRARAYQELRNFCFSENFVYAIKWMILSVNSVDKKSIIDVIKIAQCILKIKAT